ncbi:MAG: c-type cytochrome [Chloroflexi bacterium]|nr:c-type cytochrome [Chloroflexota bacterium]
MIKVLKWLGIGLGALLGVIVIAVVVLLLLGRSRVNRSYNIQVETVAIPSDAASVQRGQHLVEAVVGCTGCHGTNLAGKKVFEEGPIGRVYAPNITGGQGSATGAYTDQDWARAIRHGVSPKGKGLLIMPVEDYNNLSAEDLGAIIAYLKAVPSVDNQTPKPDIRPLGRILVALGAFGEVVPAQLVDHTASLPGPVAPGVNVEYGGYLVSISGCKGCHGKDLSGAQPPEPGAPLAPNLTRGGHLGKWSEAEFIRTLRTGVEPDGEEMDAEFMPWEEYAKMTDEEMGAIWRYLLSLPAKESTAP